MKLAPDVGEELPLSGEMLRINEVMAHAYEGSLHHAVELGGKGHRSALDAGAPEIAGMWGMNLAECHLLAGNIELALGTMFDALVIARERDPFSVHGTDAAVASVQAHQAYLQRGRLRLAPVAGARAAFVAAHCSAVRTPALLDTAPVPLTARELEIARLAAGDLHSRDLAARLGISIRTVDNHLGAIYDKLGVAGRAELSCLMGASGADGMLAPAGLA